MINLETKQQKKQHKGLKIFLIVLASIIAVIAIFKDPRQLEQFDCCNQLDKSYLDFGPISNEVKNRLTKTKFYYYRQAAVPPIPNTQIPR